MLATEPVGSWDRGKGKQNTPVEAEMTQALEEEAPGKVWQKVSVVSHVLGGGIRGTIMNHALCGSCALGGLPHRRVRITCQTRQHSYSAWHTDTHGSCAVLSGKQ